jgi:DNA-binding GntR family transcriptional regulator
MDIAERVLNGDYREGQRVSGRSTLSGLYNVSPETVRRALTLLQEAGVVRVLPGAGVQVSSVDAARDYLAETGQYKIIKEMQEHLATMIAERNELNSRIEHLTTELLEHVSRLVATKHKI